MNTKPVEPSRGGPQREIPRASRFMSEHRKLQSVVTPYAHARKTKQANAVEAQDYCDCAVPPITSELDSKSLDVE